MIFSTRLLGSSIRASSAPTYKVMTVKIEQNNSDPETAVTYHDDAVNMTVGSEEWDEFFGHYPVMLLDGVEGKKLDKTNRTLYEDGTQADITSGAEGDVMVCFPRRGIKIETDETTNVITVSMTDNPDAQADGFEYYAHFRRSDGSTQDKMYVGVYKSFELNGKLMSLSGKTISQLTLTNHYNKAQAKSVDYRIRQLPVNTYLQTMFLLKYKTRDSQTVIGLGPTGIPNSAMATGGIETQPMDYGTQNAGEHCNLFGLEDLWGNRREFIDGIRLYVNGNFLSNSYTPESANADETLKMISSRTSANGNITKVIGTTKGGLCPYEVNTVSPTYTSYFTDRGHLICSARRVFTTSGSHELQNTNMKQGGIFGIVTSDNESVASRIIYI